MDSDEVHHLITGRRRRGGPARGSERSPTDQVDGKNPGDLVTGRRPRGRGAADTGSPARGLPGRGRAAARRRTPADPALLTRYAAAEHAFTVDPVAGTENFVHRLAPTTR